MPFSHKFAAAARRRAAPQRSPARELIPDPGYCVTCDHARDAERRECFFLSLLLKERGLECYRRPAMVCMPHLLRLAGFSRSQPDSAGLSTFTARPVADLRSMLSDRGTLLRSIPSPTRPPLGRSSRSLVRPSRGSALPPDGADDVFQARCPIRSSGCADGWRRAMGARSAPRSPDRAGDWLGWLAGAANGPEDLSDVVPLCRHHVWQGCSRTEPDAGRLAGAASAASEATPVSPTPGARLTSLCRWARGSFPSTIRCRWVGRRRRADALQSLRRARECPLCRRAHEACERMILLLAALLDERAGRRAFECGYGLCVPHASRALGLLDDRVAGRIIAQTIHARLGVLRWELEEQLRRCSWGARPEGHGAEAGAWRRATLRFSGTVCDDGP